MASYSPETPSLLERTKSQSRMEQLSGSLDTTATPSRHSGNNNSTPESPMLINALKLAANNGSGSNDSIDSEYFSPLPLSPSDQERGLKRSNSNHSLASSYANSIETMAATAEAAAINRPRKSPKKSPKKSYHSGSSIGSSRHPRSQHMGSKKQLFSSKHKRVTPKLKAGCIVAVVILLPFLAMEIFLSVLVFSYNYYGVGVGEGFVIRENISAVGLVNLNVDDLTPQQQIFACHDEGESMNEGDIDGAGELECDDVPASQPAQVEEEDEEAVDVPKSQIEELQSMLQTAMKKITHRSDKEDKKVAEMLCHMVWNRAVEAGSSPDEHEDKEHDSLDALAVDAQRCLGGIELAFLSRDVNLQSVRKSRVIFESLADADPHNADVRGGLGTSLLMLGVMKEDEALLKLAMLHLKTASSLCQKGGIEDRPQSIFQSDANVISAAILHNLALASISLGDDASSVPLLLQAGAIRRQKSNQSETLFWSLSDDALLAIEQQAVLMAAKRSTSQKKRKARIPFLSDQVTVKRISI